jgi:uncharacterized membrane protein
MCGKRQSVRGLGSPDHGYDLSGSAAIAKESQMNRTTGTGFLGLGIVLLIVGALMRYAVTATTDGFNINTAGVILLWAGIVAFIMGVTFIAMGSQRRSMSQSSVQQTPTGEVRTEERIDSGGTPIA